ncbi:Transmembrane protease serine 6 [Mactra antiquata]
MRCLLLAIALVVAVHCDESLVQSVEEQLVAAVKKNSPLLASPRITGGAGTFYGLHPYIVSIYYDDNFVCGGTIYNARTIITPAVCVGFDPDQSNGRFTIKVGDHKRVQKDDYEEKRNVQDIIMGDLGGPLVCYDNTYTAYQMGIIQFGNGCDYGFSGHTRLSRYKTWIENNAEYDY